MNKFNNIYSTTLKQHREESKKRFNESSKSFESLKNKDSDYAIAVKAINDLHKQVCDVYNGAPDEI